MTARSDLKSAAHALARKENISYTAARRRLTGDAADVAMPPIPPEALTAAGTDPAAGYNENDPCRDAVEAFNAAARLEYWEQRRAGRPVRLWDVEIEVRAAATSPEEAHWLLGVGYLHRPVFRVPGLRADAVALDGGVTLVPPDRIPADERARLVASYPRRPTPWSPVWEENTTAQDFDVHRYAVAVNAAAARVDGEGDVPGEDEPSSQAPTVQIYAITLGTYVLDAVNINTARRRAQELAATIVDAAGRPLGRVVGLAPDDGDLNRITGAWEHPAVMDLAGDLTKLWDDYDAARSGLHAHSLARTLRSAAQRLRHRWNADQAETAAYTERRHLHPDGTLTLASPRQITAAVQEILAEHAGDTAEQLDAAATNLEYLAHRVYGKAAEVDGVDPDADEIRLDIVTAQARALRALAGGPARY